ncbi:MAG: CPBP family intramembrane metalloprotease [Methanobrevibacter sp.]|nr:CPBP family intramembrane metalloprotease [Methanobrevibacter sp.]
MTNKFLDNAKQGKNNFWRYALTTVMSFGVAQFISLFYLIIFLAFQLVLIGDSDFDKIFYFISIFFSFSIPTIFLLVFLEVLHKRNIRSLINTVDKYDVFGRTRTWIERIHWNRFFKGFLIWSLFLIIIETIAFILYPEDFTLNWDLRNFSTLFLLFLIAIPIQVTFEELFFRGYLNQGLSLKIKNPIIIITISSLAFGFAHLLNGDEILSMTLYVYSAFIVGIIWSIYTLLDNGIEWSTGAHLANNFFAFVIVGGEGSMDNFGTLFSVKGSDPFVSIIFSTVTLLGFLIVLVLYKKDKILKL